MRTWLCLAVLAAGAALLAGCGGSGQQQPTPEVQTEQTIMTLGGKLAWSSNSQGDYDVYVRTFGVEGKVWRVARSTGAESSPCWSRDRTKLVFVSSRCGHEQLYTVNADGTSLKRVTFYKQADREPCWNANGTRLAFTRGTEAQRAIWTMKADGSDLKRLTLAKGYVEHPSWSPDGSKIVFARSNPIAANPDICTINSGDGSGLTRLTTNSAPDRNPEYSWDGQWIAFDSTRGNGGGTTSIWRMKADGSGEIRVTSGTYDLQPTWSPDGRRLTFTRTIGGGSQLFSTSTVGNSPVQITDTPGYNVNASWADVP